MVSYSNYLEDGQVEGESEVVVLLLVVPLGEGDRPPLGAEEAAAELGLLGLEGVLESDDVVVDSVDPVLVEVVPPVGEEPVLVLLVEPEGIVLFSNHVQMFS